MNLSRTSTRLNNIGAIHSVLEENESSVGSMLVACISISSQTDPCFQFHHDGQYNIKRPRTTESMDSKCLNKVIFALVIVDLSCLRDWMRSKGYVLLDLGSNESGIVHRMSKSLQFLVSFSISDSIIRDSHKL